MDQDEQGLFDIRVHLGFIVQADGLEAARALVRSVKDFCARTPGLVFVHKEVSADKLWLKRGSSP